MSIKLETVLALLLLPIISGIPSAVGQNTLSNITTVSDIIDFVGNATEGVGEQAEQQQPLSSGGAEVEQREQGEQGAEVEQREQAEQQQPSSSGGGETESPLSLETIEDLSSSTVASDADDTSSVTAGESILVNEVELNPSGNDNEEGEWIELYNPTDVDININNFGITPSFQSPTIELPPDAV